MKHRLRDSNLKMSDKKVVDDDPYKLSIHTSSNFNRSDSGSNRLNISRMLENSRKKISMRKASQLFSSGVRPQSSKVAKRNQVIQFDNIKWLSIISAYDPSRLMNVSVSKKTCQKFLSSEGQNMKSDSRNMLYFNDLIKNFKSWLNKIHIQYYYIMQKFLFARRSVNLTLVQLRPKLDQVINQTMHMQQNLQDCLKSYQNHEFRQLLRKYYVYLERSRQIQDIIVVVNKSKNRIVDLFKKFDDDRKIQEKINKVKNDGIHEVKQIVKQYNEVKIQNKIMDRIQEAINQMAQKSGQAYRKIRGVKQLIQKFKSTEDQSNQVMNKVDMQAINLMGKVCKEICFEAETFESFSSKFLLQGDIVNDDLKRIIKKYEEQVVLQRKRAIELQMRFLNIIFSQTIKKLKENSKIAIVYENAQEHHDEYRKILRMIQDISDCMLDQNRKMSLQKLIKQTRTTFDRLYDELKYLKQNKKFEQIDTEEGLISILEVSKLISEYKSKIHSIRKKFELAFRDMALSPMKMQPVLKDPESDFISQVIELSKKINNSGLREKIDKSECFMTVRKLGLEKMAVQLKDQKILNEVKAISNQFLELQQRNILEKYFGPLRLNNYIFKESVVLAQLKSISSFTKQKDLLPQLTKILNIRNQWIQKYHHVSHQMERYFERVLANTLVKGLKSQDIKQIEDSRIITFPTKESEIQGLERKAKYRKVLMDLIEEAGKQGNIILQKNRQHDHYHSKGSIHHKPNQSHTSHQFYVSSILDHNITTINNFIESFKKITAIRMNLSSESFLPKESLIELSEKLFTEVFIKGHHDHNDERQIKVLDSYVGELVDVCAERVLNLTRRILEEENLWRQRRNHNNSDRSIQLSKIPTHVQKVVELLQFYKNATSTLSEASKQSLQLLHTRIDNVQNSAKEVRQYQILSLYSKVICGIVRYCKQTQQIVHVTLDKDKCPIAVSDVRRNALQHVFPGLKKGKQLQPSEGKKLTINEAKVGIQLKMKKAKEDLEQLKSRPKSKAGVKQKKKKSEDIEDMDEDIIQSSNSEMMGEEINDDFNDEMDEDMPEDSMPEDDMPQDDMYEEEFANEEINQQQQQMPEEQPQDDIEEENLQEEQKLQELLDQSQQHLSKSKANQKSKHNKSKQEIDDFEEYDWEDESQIQKKKIKKQKDLQEKRKKQAKERQAQLKAKKEQQQRKLKEKQEQMAKQEEEKQRQQRMKKQHIAFSQTQPPKKIVSATIYELFPFITSLHRLYSLISYLHSFQSKFMLTSINWGYIQQHFNNHHHEGQMSQQQRQAQEKQKKQVEKYMQKIQQDVQKSIKKDFQKEPVIFEQIKGLEMIKRLKKNLLLLKNANWSVLEQILTHARLSYNILKHNSNTLYIWIRRNDASQYDPVGCIDGYLLKSFKFYDKTKFDLKSYVERCFNCHRTQEDEFRQITYSPKQQKSLVLSSEQTQQNYIQTIRLIEDFTTGTKDHVNKLDLCLQMYKKALGVKQKVQLDLEWYSMKIKFLNKHANDESDVVSYVTYVKENVKAVIKRIKSLQSKLYNLTFKCELGNIYESINELKELYGSEIQREILFKKGGQSYTMLVFDKRNIKENLSKINGMLSTDNDNDKNQEEKMILRLIFGSGSGQINEVREVDEQRIMSNSQKVCNMKASELILSVMRVLRVDHTWLKIQKHSFEMFTVRSTQNQCIYQFVSRITQSIKQDKSLSTLITDSSYLSGLKALVNVKKEEIGEVLNDQIIAQRLKRLFTWVKEENQLLKSVELKVDEAAFDLDNAKRAEKNQKLIKGIAQNVEGEKKQVSRMVQNLSKMKLSRFIYEKHITSKLSQTTLKILKGHLQTLQSILHQARSTSNQTHWLLSLISLSKLFTETLIPELEQNIGMIKQIMAPVGTGSLGEVVKEMKAVFKWIGKLLAKAKEERVKVSVVVVQQTKEVVWFDIGNQFKLDMEYFAQNFSFIQPQSKPQLTQFLFTCLTKSVQTQKPSQQIKETLKVNPRTTTLTLINSSQLSSSLSTYITQKVSQEYYTNRNNTIKQFVRVFNKMYFVSKTTGELNFLAESQKLTQFQNDIKSSLEELQLTYALKRFIANYSGFFNSQALNKVLNVLQKQFKSLQLIQQNEIQQSLTKLSKVTINKKLKSIDSYKPFYSWVYHTVMSILKLPFYNLITSTNNHEQSEFLAVILAEQDNLEQQLTQLLPYHEHKPIYRNEQQDLTIELIKQPIYISMQLQKLEQVIGYLNQHLHHKDKETRQELHLRVDQISNEQAEERKILKFINLKNFKQKKQQELNIIINQDNLSVNLQVNVVFGTNPQTLPLNGTQVDQFSQVYIGKHLILSKIPSYLLSQYNQIKNTKEIQTNRPKVLQSFFKNFCQHFFTTISPESKPVVIKIFKKIDYKDISAFSKQNPKNKFYLNSSQKLYLQCNEELMKFKAAEYKRKPQLEQDYDKDISELVKNFQKELYRQILKAQVQIRQNMQKKIKKSASDKLEEIKLTKVKNEQLKKQKASQKKAKGQKASLDSAQRNLQNQNPALQHQSSSKSSSQQQQQLQKLKQTSFQQYLYKYLSLKLPQLTQAQYQHLHQQILSNCSTKHSQHKQISSEKFKKSLITRMDNLYDEQSGNEQIKKNGLYLKLLFLFIIFEQNDFSYVRLFFLDQHQV